MIDRFGETAGLHASAAKHDQTADPVGSVQDRESFLLTSYRIVHVDDDSVENLLLKKLLSKCEQSVFEVYFVDNYSDALSCLKSESFDIGLIDYQLGDATGLNLVENLGGRRSGTPLVILTGRGGRKIDVKATRAGAYDYLDKNDLGPELLERTIRNVRVQFEVEQQLRKSEELLRQAKSEAEAANRSKSEYLARMSHDLRTPLNAILGFSEVIRDQLLGPLGNQKYLSYASDIHQSGQLLLSMVNEVLNLSKVETGIAELHEDDIALNDLASAVLALFTPSAETAGLSLRAEIGADLPELRGDRQMVHRMLTNLLSNAVKFTPRGGQIVIHADVTESGLRLIVEDNGIGISPQDIGQALEPFGQLTNSMQASPGFGLGLAIVRSLIELHGGSLSIEDVPTSGTRVAVTFPADRIGSPPTRH